MANIVSDQLFQLIKSLTKSEKRSFKLLFSRTKSGENALFIKLFDIIDKQAVYNEKDILLKEKAIKPIQLPNLKANLYKQILKGLRTANTTDDIDMSIREMLDNAKILYNKCLYDQCSRMIDKAKQQADKYERPVFMFEIIEFEKNLISNITKTNIEKRVNQLSVEGETTLNKLKNINTFSNMSLSLESFYLKIGYIRDQKDFEIANSYLYSKMPIFKEDELSFDEKIHLYHSLVSYYFFIQDFTRGYEYAKKWVQLFHDKPESIFSKTELYLKALNNLLKAQSKLNKINEFEETLLCFKKIKEHSNTNLSYNLQLILFKYDSMNRLNLFFMQGDFKGGSKIIQDIAQDLEKYFDKIDHHIILIFYYKFACMYFGCDNYKRASFWLTKIINAKEEDLRSDIHCFARIVNLICHYEMGNYDLVDYYIKSTYRYLLKKDDIHRFQKHLLKFLRRLGYIKTADLPDAFRELQQQLTPLTNDPYEKRAFIYFDIISWLESKVTKIPVEEIISEKAKKINRTFEK